MYILGRTPLGQQAGFLFMYILGPPPRSAGQFQFIYILGPPPWSASSFLFMYIL